MKLFIKLLFLVGFVSLSAQNKLSGKVTDMQNKPLFGVEIYATELHKGTITDENGEYILKNIPSGYIKISFSYLGYHTEIKTVESSSENQIVNIKLKESIFSTDEIIVSTPFNKLQSENVMKVEHMTAKSLQKTGAITLAEGIESIAGISQISTGVSIGKPVIRGLSGNRVLVYTQGVRLENQQFGGEHGLGINEAGIESIEVIKGSASLLYGSDALGGVIYFNPEKFASVGKTDILFNQRYFSNTLGSNTSVALKTSSYSWKFLARGTLNFHSDYKIPLNKRVTNTRYRENDFKAGIGYNSSKYVSELRYNFNNSLLGITEGIGLQSNTTLPEEPFQKIDNHILSLHNHLFFSNSKLDADFGYIHNDRNEFEEHEEGETHSDDEDATLRMKLKTFNFNIKYHFPEFTNGIETIFGLQGMYQTNKNFGEELLIPDAKINDIGIFGTVNYQWEQSSLQAGLRFDTRYLKTENHIIIHDGDEHIFNALDKKYTSFTASLGYKFLLFDKITTRINTATGFRSPNLAELTSNGIHHGTNRFEIGNSNLKNEKNIQFDLSLDYLTDHIEIFANTFYNNLDDYIYLSPTGEIEDDAKVFEYVQNNAELYGGEFGFNLHPHPLDWIHIKSSFEMVVGKQNNGNHLPLIPANTLKNTLRIEFNIQNWLQNGYSSLSLNSSFAQKNISQFETSTSGYNLVNLGLGGDILIKKIKFNISLSINNVFDAKYTNHLSRLKPEGILNAGRNIVLGLKFFFGY